MTLLLSRRGLVFLAAAVLLPAFSAFGGFAWHYAGVIDAGALRVDQAPPQRNLRVVEVGGGRIVLARLPGAAPTANWQTDGLWGLDWEGGYARVGPIIAAGPNEVVREFEPAWGTPQAGDGVRLDSFAFPHEPAAAFDIAYPYETEAGRHLLGKRCGGEEEVEAFAGAAVADPDNHWR